MSFDSASGPLPAGTAIHVGTQGWSYADWVGPFYPPGSKQEHYLPFYARVFDTVELDTTFYHPPRPSIVRSWARHTPEGFRFAAKAPRAITHEAGLEGQGPALADFVRALEPLGEKLGPILVQMPAAFGRSPATERSLAGFLEAAPRGVRLAFEFRSAAWHDASTADALRHHGAALVWSVWRDLPPAQAITADFLYLRWMGERERVERMDRVVIDRGDELDRSAEEVRRALPRVREVFAYFNNHWAGHSPASANALKRRLGLVAVEPQEAAGQGELW